MKRKAPYYESRFIRANNPGRMQALWLRETLLLPRSGTASADVWLMVFDPDGVGNRALKLSYPVGEADFRDQPWTVHIAATTLDDYAVSGAIDDRNSPASWRLAITPGDEPAVKLLTDRGYKAPIPTAKTMVRHPLARFDGSVELADRRVTVDGWTGSVNHNWGRRHTPAYAFGQVCGFGDDPDASLEIVTARAGIGPLLLPPVTLLVLRYGGTEYAVRSPIAARRTRGSYQPFTWSFGAKIDGVNIDGEIRTAPAHVIGLTYTDTDGGSKFCYNSAIATCELTLSGAVTAQLRAERTAMFEILTKDAHPDVPLLA
jgi:hypothetical protein